MSRPRSKPDPEPLIGPQWTDISISEVDSLPTIPKDIIFHDPQFLARGGHSQAFTVTVSDGDNTYRAVLKVFSKQFKKRYVREVNAYRFLYHYGVPAQGVVPNVMGTIPTITKKKLDDILQDSIPDNITITLPASAVLLEYLDKAQRASSANMTHALAAEALRGLRLIHNAHVLHGDAEARNILVYPETGKVVWLDFSSAEINRAILGAILERRPVKQLLYRTLVRDPTYLITWDVDGRNRARDRAIWR